MKSASVGFTVLLIGGVASGLAVRLLPAADSWWMPLVSVAGYLVAASRVGEASRPWLQGVLAASAAWTLVMPVRLFASDGSWGPTRLAADLVLAVLVGATTGLVIASLRRREDRKAARLAKEEAERRAQEKVLRPVRRPQRNKRRARRRG